MRPRLLWPISAAVSCLLFNATPSVGAQIHCPDSITETPTVSMDDRQWVIITKTGERPLEHVGIYLGTVSEHGAQIPDSTKRAKLRETVTWNIRRSSTDSFWIGCSYVGTTAVLFQQLDPGIKRCIATYDLLPSGRRQRLTTLDCQ